ncbi:hypothetical protein J6590_018285 [Homalodisca vitripennis]|nr:hypothetical protein J6590_018285 [Homalodisca vitripennis]
MYLTENGGISGSQKCCPIEEYSKPLSFTINRHIKVIAQREFPWHEVNHRPIPEERNWRSNFSAPRNRSHGKICETGSSGKCSSSSRVRWRRGLRPLSKVSGIFPPLEARHSRPGFRWQESRRHSWNTRLPLALAARADSEDTRSCEVRTLRTRGVVFRGHDRQESGAWTSKVKPISVVRVTNVVQLPYTCTASGYAMHIYE